MYYLPLNQFTASISDSQQESITAKTKKSVAKLLIVTLLVFDFPVPVMNARAADVPANQWITVPLKADPMMQNLNIPANAATQGMWSGVFSWPLNGLHTNILPDGRVLTYGTPLDGNTQNGRYFDVWNPSLGFGANSHQTSYSAQRQDSFCSAATYLNNGNLLITGGNGVNTSSIFNPLNNGVSQASYNTALDRWYATLLNLPDGRPIIMGGMDIGAEAMQNFPDLAIAQGLPSMTPEILESNGWRSLTGATSRIAFGPDYLRVSYPRAWVAPNGQVFGISSDKMWYLDPAANSGNGSVIAAGNFKTPYSSTNIVNAGATSSAVMFAPGKILQVGGNGGFNGDGLPASNQATVVDINNGTPLLTEQPTLTHQRRYPNTIVLANGQIVVTGGTKLGNSNGTNAVFATEIWTPTAPNGSSGTWSTHASAAIYRGYHSQTALLPNGTILSVGGGTPGPVTNLNAEIYYPPNLFRSVGTSSQLAPRPVIKAISGLSYSNNADMQLDMETSNTISQLALVGLSQGTHSFNSGQRRIPLTFTQNDIRLTTITPNANLAPPGYYQVVAIDSAGVPSLGVIVAIGQGQTPPQVPTNPYTPPDLNNNLNVPVINAGGTASYTVNALNGYTYSWNFGDGSPSTAYSSNPTVTKTFTQPGTYVVTLSSRSAEGIVTNKTWLQAVATPKTANSPSSSSPIILEKRINSSNRVWVANPDNDSVSVIDDTSKALLATINVGISPRTLAAATDGRIWVVNKESATISIVSPTTLTVVQTVTLPRASQPHGIAFAPDGGSAYLALEATGQLLKLNPSNGVQLGIINVGSNPRHLAVSADSETILVSRFITPLLPGEATASIDTSTAGAEVVAVNAGTMTLDKTIILHHSDKTDTEIQGSGIPNYLAAAVISPNGTTAWLPSKQDNIKRGIARNGQPLNFQNTVRAISSRIDMTTLTEDLASRIDHDNSSVGSAAAYHPSGVYIFVALETSRQVAIVDAIRGSELFRINVGRAPQGLALSSDGNTLYVQEFMDRSVGVFDLRPLTQQGLLSAASTTVIFTVTAEKMSAQAVLGKQLFYDAKDPRLSLDSYMSCASCHNDGGHDGRVWDLTGFGEGLRNTISLKGRAAMGHGNLHWSANFDELQDFEGQIRTLAGGAGLMTDAQFNTGTRNQPLGDRKTGVSADLDNLTAYVASLNTFAQSPNRNTDGTLTATATAGKTVFANSCASCHGGANFTLSSDGSNLRNIGTINALSGQRLGAALAGIDVPTLRDVWATAPYLHNGSAATVTAAVQAHNNLTLNATDLANVVAYVQQIGGEEIVSGSSSANWKFDETSGNTVADSSGNANPLTLSNVTRVAGTTGQAGQFNGWNSVASAGKPVINTAESFTVSAWVKLNTLTGINKTMVSQDGANVSNFYLQHIPSQGNKFGLSIMSADSFSGTSTFVRSSITPVVGQWYHVVGVRNKAAGNIKLYVDGVLQGTAAYTAAWNATGPLVIGRGKWGGNVDWVNGAIDDVSTYATALSDAEVAQLYNGTTTSNVAPTVNLTAPTANAVFTQGTAITISATAADSDGTVAQVQFFDGATLIGTDTTAPYSMSLANAAVGPHSFTAVATDNNGTSTTSAAISVTVNALPNVAPTVALTSPTANATFTQGTAITISATAADSDGTVTQVQFFDGTTLIGTDTTAPYSMSYTGVALGARSLTAVATDNNGTSTTSAAISVTVDPLPNVAPTVSLTAPTANAVFTQGTAITISATAADSDGTVTQVQFFDGTTLIGTDTTAPYSMSYTGAALGARSLTAVATDNNGTSTTSAAISVTVNALPGGTTTPSANWKFNETSGNTVADSSGNANPLTLSNVTRVAGTTGQAGQFNGWNSVASAGKPVINTAESFTVSAWVKLNTLTGINKTMVSQDGANVSNFYLQHIPSQGNKFGLSIMSADSFSGTSTFVRSSITPVVGQWYHVVGVRNKAAGNIKLYVDGVLQGTAAYTAAWNATGPLVIGRGKWGGNVDWVNGAIDDVSTYATALSDAEVAQLYSGN